MSVLTTELQIQQRVYIRFNPLPPTLTLKKYSFQVDRAKLAEIEDRCLFMFRIDGLTWCHLFVPNNKNTI